MTEQKSLFELKLIWDGRALWAVCVHTSGKIEVLACGVTPHAIRNILSAYGIDSECAMAVALRWLLEDWE